MNDRRIVEIFRVSNKNEDFIATQEGYTVEYKENFGWGNISDYARAMAAMANNKGGHIIFGIKDKPHELLGLNKKSIKRFEEKDLSQWSKYMRDYFEPAIEFDKSLYTFNDKVYGIIEVKKAETKPVICKKYVDNKLRLGAIYYRYKAENTEIQYAELRKILDEEQKKINIQWLEKIKQISLAGVANTMILNTESGELQGDNRSLYISSDLLDKIRFVDKGRFVETDGEAVLSIVGEVKRTQDVPIPVTVGKKEVAISNNRIIETFVFEESTFDSEEYIKFILNSQAKNLPIFYYIKNMEDLDIDNMVGYSATKKHILERIDDFSYYEPLKDTGTSAYIQKKKARDLLLKLENIDKIKADKDIRYVLTAMRSIDSQFIVDNQQYFMEILKFLYSNKYQSMEYIIKNEYKHAICYIDEVLYRQAI